MGLHLTSWALDRTASQRHMAVEPAGAVLPGVHATVECRSPIVRLPSDIRASKLLANLNRLPHHLLEHDVRTEHAVLR